jgi:hypothetical protein
MSTPGRNPVHRFGVVMKPWHLFVSGSPQLEKILKEAWWMESPLVFTPPASADALVYWVTDSWDLSQMVSLKPLWVGCSPSLPHKNELEHQLLQIRPEVIIRSTPAEVVRDILNFALTRESLLLELNSLEEYKNGHFRGIENRTLLQA